VVISLSLIGWFAYRVITSEERRDKFYASAVLTKEKSWLILLELLRTPKKMRAGYELSGRYRQFSDDEVDSALRSLAKDGLVKPEILPSGNDMRLVWKAKA
jgi:hypothetical protein